VPGLALYRARAKALFLWAELIRGIPLIFVIFWMWYLLPLITGGDLPGALTVTLALAWLRQR
jgi:polar amino acid transport system permease protein